DTGSACGTAGRSPRPPRPATPGTPLRPTAVVAQITSLSTTLLATAVPIFLPGVRLVRVWRLTGRSCAGCQAVPNAPAVPPDRLSRTLAGTAAALASGVAVVRVVVSGGSGWGPVDAAAT